MAKEPEDRFQSASALLQHLDQVFGRAADTTPPPLGEDEVAPQPTLPVRTMSDEFYLKVDAVEQLPGDRSLESQEMARSERRRWLVAVAIAAAALLVAGGAVIAHYRGEPARRPVAAAEPAPVPAAQPVVAPDAGASPAPPPTTDAAPAVQIAARVAEPAVHKPARDRRKKDPPGQPLVSPTDFDRRYREVARALDRLTTEKGDAAADSLSKKYFAIPYADALRSDSVRRDADRTLRTLASRIDAELKK
jgi:hypothetical protein